MLTKLIMFSISKVLPMCIFHLSLETVCTVFVAINKNIPQEKHRIEFRINVYYFLYFPDLKPECGVEGFVYS